MRKGRLYRVRPSIAADFPTSIMTADEARHEAGRGALLTIRRIDGAHVIVAACSSWQDTDAWAGDRWRRIEMARRQLEGTH